MHRTQIYLPDGEYERLLHLSQARSTSMAELIRSAVRRFLTQEAESSALETLERTFGTCDGRDQDSQETVRGWRAEWAERDRRHAPPA